IDVEWTTMAMPWSTYVSSPEGAAGSRATKPNVPLPPLAVGVMKPPPVTVSTAWAIATPDRAVQRNANERNRLVIELMARLGGNMDERSQPRAPFPRRGV